MLGGHLRVGAGTFFWLKPSGHSPAAAAAWALLVVVQVSTEVDAHLSHDTAVGAWLAGSACVGWSVCRQPQQQQRKRKSWGGVPAMSNCCRPPYANALPLVPTLPTALPPLCLLPPSSPVVCSCWLQATYDKALHLVDLYMDRGVEPSRLYIKVRGVGVCGGVGWC
jgi:hypothetical protein